MLNLECQFHVYRSFLIFEISLVIVRRFRAPFILDAFQVIHVAELLFKKITRRGVMMKVHVNQPARALCMLIFINLDTVFDISLGIHPTSQI